MRRLAYVVGIVVTAILASCGSDGASPSTTNGKTDDDPVSASEPRDPLEGTWHTEITCQEMVAALEQAGVSESVPGVVQDEFGLDQRPERTDPCAGVDGTADHTLRFEGGHFALFAGEEVGLEASYELIDEDTFVTGPPDLFTVDFHLEGDSLTMRIVKPTKQAPYIATWESAPWEREN
jgi:hypothetical protein